MKNFYATVLGLKRTSVRTVKENSKRVVGDNYRVVLYVTGKLTLNPVLVCEIILKSWNHFCC